MRTIVVLMTVLWLGACDGADEPELVAVPSAPPKPMAAAVARIAAVAPPALPVEPPQLEPVVAAEDDGKDEDSPDTDTDDIPDVEDRCPDPPETVNGFDDNDGCPEPALVP